MASQKINLKLLEELIREVTPSFKLDLTEKTDLFDAGALDSFSTLQLVQILEERLDIVFDYTDLNAKNLLNIENLVSLLQKKYNR